MFSAAFFAPVYFASVYFVEGATPAALIVLKSTQGLFFALYDNSCI